VPPPTARNSAEGTDEPMAEPEKKRQASSELERLRERIDAIDHSILERLNDRAGIVREVGQLKESSGAAVYSADRERSIVQKLEAANPGPFPNEGIGPVFREIISATRSLEEVLKVGYMGPEGTYSHAAALQQFGELAKLRPFRSIADVFAAVERGKIGLGVVPVENTTEGVVAQTLDLLPGFDGTVCGELQLRVSHDLLSQSGRLSDVRQVISHPQPLAQCREWLNAQLPEVERVEAASTAVAAQLAAGDSDLAAIGSTASGQVYGLKTVESAIEDRRDNTTRFLLIGTQSPEASGHDLTSVVFTIRKDESGGLFRLLEPVARLGVNLTSIQLRPIKGKPWEYLFFLDLEGHVSEARVSDALAAAGKIANSTRVLGSFPRARKAREG
jgi:chorismate mutase/prephenate dehydratase